MTVKEAQAAGLIELTVPSDPNERIETQWGELTVREWLSNEWYRITRWHRTATIKRSAIVIAHDDGNLSLWVNPVRPQLEAVE